MNRILFLDNAIDHAAYYPLAHWASHFRYPYDAFRTSEGELPGDLSSYSHVLVSGSEGSIMEDHDWLEAEMELVRDAVRRNLVHLGSCFGHQLLARALYGKKAVCRRPAPEVGWAEVAVLTTDPLLGRAGESLHTFVIHYDEVVNLPEAETEVLASSTACGVQAFRLKRKPVWGIQPHPEFSEADARDVAGMLAERDPVHRELIEKALRAQPRDSGWMVPLMKAFQKAEPAPFQGRP